MFNKRYRNAQRVLDVEARQVATSVSDIDAATKKSGTTTGEIDTLLGGMVRLFSIYSLNFFMVSLY